MIVTDLKYYLDDVLVSKLDIMIKRVEAPLLEKDVVLSCEGAEGEGKTNSSLAMAYYVKYKTGRDIHLFFRLKSLIEFAKNNTHKIIIWDEPALDFLSTDHYKEMSKDLIRLLMTSRINRHFFIFNFTKFYKFSEYIVVDRAIGLLHMYSRNEVEAGRFVYIKKRNLEHLFNAYRSSKKRSYKIFASFRGNFTRIDNLFDQMGLIIEGKPDCTLEEYRLLKKDSIESIGSKDKAFDKSLNNLNKLKSRIGYLTFPIMSQELLAKALGTTSRSIQRWKTLPFVEEEALIPKKNEDLDHDDEDI